MIIRPPSPLLLWTVVIIALVVMIMKLSGTVP